MKILILILAGSFLVISCAIFGPGKTPRRAGRARERCDRRIDDDQRRGRLRGRRYAERTITRRARDRQRPRHRSWLRRMAQRWCVTAPGRERVRAPSPAPRVDLTAPSRNAGDAARYSYRSASATGTLDAARAVIKVIRALAT